MSAHFAYPGLFLFAFEKALFDQCPFECPILLLVRHFDLADRIEKPGDRFVALLFGDGGQLILRYPVVVFRQPLEVENASSGGILSSKADPVTNRSVAKSRNVIAFFMVCTRLGKMEILSLFYGRHGGHPRTSRKMVK